MLEGDICLIKTEIDNWNSDGFQMGFFIELVQYAKNIGGKSRKNLVEHPIIKNDLMTKIQL